MKARSWTLLCLLGVLLLALPGCARCGGEEGAERPQAQRGVTPPSPLPATPAALTRSLAERVPASAEGFAVVRDWSAFLAGYRALRDRLPSERATIAQIEGDLRNTLGLDVENPGSLAALGVAEHGGMAVAQIAGVATVFLFLDDPERFRERLVAVLQDQPFGLRAPVVEREVAGHRVLEFREEEEGPLRLGVGIRGNVGMLLMARDAAAVDAVLTASQGAEGGSVADMDGFDRAVGHLDGYPIVVLASLERARQLGEEVEQVPPALLRGLGPLVALGVAPRSDRMEVRVLGYPTGEVLQGLRQATRMEDRDLRFSQIMPPDTYAVARMSLQPEAFRADDWVHLVPGLAEAIPAEQREMFEQALGPRVIAMLTRTRMVTLMRLASSREVLPGDLADALGAIVAVEVRDAETVREALEAAVAASDDLMHTFEDRGERVYAFRDPALSLLTIVLTGDLLFLVPDRQRGPLLDDLAGEAFQDAVVIRESAYRVLSGPGAANGFYMDLNKILTGPLATTLNQNLPIDVRRLAGLADQVGARLQMEEDHVRLNASMHYGPVPAAP